MLKIAQFLTLVLTISACEQSQVAALQGSAAGPSETATSPGVPDGAALPTPADPKADEIKITGREIIVNAGESLSDALDKAKSGDVFLIEAGTYKENIELNVSNITVEARTPRSVKIAGDGNSSVFAPKDGKNGADQITHITLKGLVFQNGGHAKTGALDTQDNTKASVIVGSDWLVEDCTIEETPGVGIALFGSGMTVRRTIAQNNGRAGIGGTGVKDGELDSCTSRMNNSKGDSNGGGGKFTRTKSLHVINHNSYANTGAGMWFDYSNINVTIEDSNFHENKDFIKNGQIKAGGDGLFFEISGEVETSPGSGKSEGHGNLVVKNSKLWGNGIGRGSGSDPRCDLLVWGSAHLRIESDEIGQLTVRNNRTEPSNKAGDNQILNSDIGSLWFDPAHKADRSLWTRDGKSL